VWIGCRRGCYHDRVSLWSQLQSIRTPNLSSLLVALSLSHSIGRGEVEEPPGPGDLPQASHIHCSDLLQDGDSSSTKRFSGARSNQRWRSPCWRLRGSIIKITVLCGRYRSQSVRILPMTDGLIRFDSHWVSRGKRALRATGSPFFFRSPTGSVLATISFGLQR